MANYFLDSSAVVKCYINETGSEFVDELIEIDLENRVFLSQITRVEVASAVTRRKKEKTLGEKDAASALATFTSDLSDLYITIEINSIIIQTAIDLVTKYALRAYDAVQLAAALAVNRDLIDNGFDALTFVSADDTLNAMAAAEGLKVINPNEF